MTGTIPVSGIIATRNRPEALARTLASLREQDVTPGELIVVDTSADDRTRVEGAGTAMEWRRAVVAGAAAQRNQGVQSATQPFVWFFDDDVLFEAGCLRRLWDGINSDPQMGGVNAMIVNQKYKPPGRISRTMFWLMDPKKESFPGAVIGPAVNILPEDRPDLPEVVPVEWLNTTCTVYRRAALPDPPFDDFFTGYSLMEDLALSLKVAKRGWKLANVRQARIVHESQSGEHKANAAALAEMELVNRHYVMTRILDRHRPSDYLRLAAYEAFGFITSLGNHSSRTAALPNLRGKARALRKIFRE